MKIEITKNPELDKPYIARLFSEVDNMFFKDGRKYSNPENLAKRLREEIFRGNSLDIILNKLYLTAEEITFLQEKLEYFKREYKNKNKNKNYQPS